MKTLFISLYLACHFGYYQSFSFKYKPFHSVVNSKSNNLKIHPHYSSSASVDLDNVESTSNDFENLNKVQKGLKILYKFCRPHTIKGTILASSMSVTRALIENPEKITVNLVPRALFGLFALLCGNAYIVGINQIYDVKIDEVNKPFLPIAAKLLSPNQAWQLIMLCVVLGLSIVKTNFSPQIFFLYLLGLVFGTLYSVPPFHLKRYPILASGIIATVRGFLLNFGTYYAVREALSIPFKWNPVVAFISCFMTLFASVIAVTKDLPDVEGDIKYNVNTFANKYGVRNVANFASGSLVVGYVSSIALGAFNTKSFSPLPMIGGHLALLAYFLYNYNILLKSNSSGSGSINSVSGVTEKQINDLSLVSVKVFYKSIWNLFYLEYCLYPFI